MVIEHRVICESPEHQDLSLDRHIGTMLRALRNDRSLRADQVAALLGITEKDYRDLELGRQAISSCRLFELCLVFDVPVTVFFENYEIAGRDGPTGIAPATRP